MVKTADLKEGENCDYHHDYPQNRFERFRDRDNSKDSADTPYHYPDHD